MAKTLLEELEATLSEQQKLALSILYNDPKIADQLRLRDEMYEIYQEGKTDPDTPPAKPAVAAASEVKPEVKPDVKPEVKPEPAVAPSVNPNDLVGTLRNEINTLLTAKFSELDSRYIPLDAKPDTPAGKKIAALRGDILASALLLSDDLATIRDDHREEFGEKLDRDSFKKFVDEAKGKYATLRDAHNSFVSEKRIEKRIADGIKEQSKHKESAASVPAQTVSSAPARQILDRARAKSTPSDGTSSMEKAVAKLREINRGREDAGAA